MILLVGCEDWWSLLPSTMLLTMPLLAMQVRGFFVGWLFPPHSLLVQLLLSDHKVMIQLDTKQSGS